ncbi:site-specific DNA-methyltransferase [Helicobacter pylori]|uniref:site-specific DNA-methyltransferase n=1 Tax=Helicobacter pylori TaxID=210 RepID=UPI001FD17074|nr:site-specific DNA-methyltransferase [Helicobacter pylori]UOR79244.1 site-specific DNA-methyltransferase [Helicobacter pylori]
MLKNPLKTLLDALINRFTKERLETLILTADEKLLTFMLEDKNANDYKNAFFKTIANSLVFNQKALLECLTKELENSFTRFENKIGLYSQGRPIKSSESVVLNFPFKDNVLLGSAKDNSTKSKELFYHEILHKKEIDTLLYKKALCRFEMHGEGDLESALKDKNTNYLIKGNNLIALHSLKKKFAKQVKCIYIDPPYNTGNDSFNYNDNFNHSSWLVFMKNRIEIAREFLSDDGVIFVQCDDNEQAYLKVLMDEIFLRENFVGCISWKQFHSVKNDAANFSKNIEYILCYCKNFSKNLISNEPFDKSNLYKLKDENGFYKLDPVWAKSGNNFSPYTFLNGKTWSPPSGTFWRYSIGTLKDMEQNAVAHKMKRRYIGIEQMDYIETITKERLKKVIEGEQGGISKKCDFKGGGSFVYAELKEVNLEVKKQILNAKSKSECLKIFNTLNERFLKRADCKISEIHSEEFQNLDLNEQKRIYCALLDANEDYLNLGDINEDAWGIDEITKKCNEIFYS